MISQVLKLTGNLWRFASGTHMIVEASVLENLEVPIMPSWTLAVLIAALPFFIREFGSLFPVWSIDVPAQVLMTEKGDSGSLFWLLKATHTAFGARLLRHWVSLPCALRALHSSD